MAITVGWGNVEEDLIVWRFEHRWNTYDFYKAFRTSNQLTLSKAHNVCVICDMRYTRLFGVNLLSLAKSSSKRIPPNLKATIIVVSSDFIPTLYRKLRVVYSWVPGNIHFVESVDTAYVLMEQLQASS